MRDTIEIPVLSHHGYPQFGFAAAVLQGLALSRLRAVFQLSPPSQTTSVEQDITLPQQRQRGLFKDQTGFSLNTFFSCCTSGETPGMEEP